MAKSFKTLIDSMKFFINDDGHYRELKPDEAFNRIVECIMSSHSEISDDVSSFKQDVYRWMMMIESVLQKQGLIEYEIISENQKKTYQ